MLSVGEWNSKKSDIKMFPGFVAFFGGVDGGSAVVRGRADGDGVFARGSVFCVVRYWED